MCLHPLKVRLLQNFLKDKMIFSFKTPNTSFLNSFLKK